MEDELRRSSAEVVNVRSEVDADENAHCSGQNVSVCRSLGMCSDVFGNETCLSESVGSGSPPPEASSVLLSLI